MSDLSDDNPDAHRAVHGGDLHRGPAVAEEGFAHGGWHPRTAECRVTSRLTHHRPVTISTNTGPVV